MGLACVQSKPQGMITDSLEVTDKWLMAKSADAIRFPLYRLKTAKLLNKMRIERCGVPAVPEVQAYRDVIGRVHKT